MAWARVQSSSAQNSGSTTITVTLGSTPTTGNIVVVGTTWANTVATSITSIVDGNSVALTLVASKSGVGGGGDIDSAVYVYTVPATPSKTFTVTGSPSGSGYSAVAIEFSGSTSTKDGTFGTAAVTTTGSATYSSTASSELLLSYSGDLGLNVSETIPSGWTADANNLNASGDANSLFAYKNSTGGSESNTWTLTSGSDIYSIITGAFTLSGGGPALPPDLIMAPMRGGF